jgi:hypothetical protein
LLVATMPPRSSGPWQRQTKDALEKDLMQEGGTVGPQATGGRMRGVLHRRGFGPAALAAVRTRHSDEGKD